MKVMIVEDDLALSDVIAFTVRRAGFDVVAVYDGASALETWEQETPDVVLLDLNLPKLDGLSVCRALRAQGDTPIVILTVRADDETVVTALESGADDYVVKPFSPTQLVARLRAVLRRAGLTPSAAVLEAAGLRLDRSRGEMQRRDGVTVRLTPLEARLMESLMLNVGQVLSSDSLINTVWGAEGADRSMLKQVMYRLRSKIEADAGTPQTIETVPGKGYCLPRLPRQAD